MKFKPTNKDDPKPKWDLTEWSEEKVFFKDHPVMDIVLETDKVYGEKRKKTRVRNVRLETALDGDIK